MAEIEIPFIKPVMPKSSDMAKDYEAIVDSNWFTNFGPFENKFRHSAEDYLANDTHVTTIANATLGLDLSIRALINRDERAKEVIIPSFTFAAGAEVILSNGLTPVFIDIDRDSLQPNIDEARRYIETRRDSMAGILLCNIFGVGNQKIAEWEDLADEFNTPLIVDTAAGFGSRYSEDENVGSRGDCEVFSLHATKPFAVGEGGLVVSKNEDFIEKIRHLQNFGFDASRQIADIGTNAKLQEVNCAIGLRQIDGFADRLSNRQDTLRLYKESLEPLGHVFQPNDELSTVAFASVITPSSELGNSIHQNLQQAGVEARRYYTPLHYQKSLSTLALRASSLAVTEDIASRIISLPVHDSMQESDIEKIISIFAEQSNEAKS
ncbi:MAG: DegT/DnrJ/EryC1/StrS family aminotransferase [Candidatus Microsaccharimonas sp.]